MEEALPTALPAVLTRAIDRFADDEAIVDGEQRLTFRGLGAQVERVAAALVGSGVASGDHVAIWAPNSAAWASAAFAVWSVGASLVPVNTRYTGREAAQILAAARCRTLLAVNGFLGEDVISALERAGVPKCIDEIVVLEGDAAGGATPLDAFLERDSESNRREARRRSAAIDPDAIANILFTSGTTGRPKGAMLRHAATVKAYQDWSDLVGLRHRDRYLGVYPFAHSAGLHSVLLGCVLQGATLVPHPVFDVPSVLRRVQEERITMLPGPPAILQSMLDHPDRDAYDLTSLRLTVTGAAVVPIEMVRRLREELPFERILTAYGLTESTGVATACRSGDDPETVATTCGRAMPDVEVIVADDKGREVRRGEPGEVLVRGYVVMAGYIDDPEATAAVVDADGWLHTGDVGVMDDWGYLRITDRIKDMLIVGGFNAYPAEIEQVILEHPAVSQVAVVGVPDDRLGEVAKAFLVLRPGCAINGDELAAWCKERLANYKVPRSFEVLDALPLNATGKVVKFKLKERARATPHE